MLETRVTANAGLLCIHVLHMLQEHQEYHIHERRLGQLNKLIHKMEMTLRITAQQRSL